MCHIFLVLEAIDSLDLNIKLNKGLFNNFYLELLYDFCCSEFQEINMWQIYISTLGGAGTITLDVDELTQISQIKHEIFHKTGIPPEWQALRTGTKQFTVDSSNLLENKIYSGNTLYMDFRQRKQQIQPMKTSESLIPATEPSIQFINPAQIIEGPFQCSHITQQKNGWILCDQISKLVKSEAPSESLLDALLFVIRKWLPSEKTRIENYESENWQVIHYATEAIERYSFEMAAQNSRSLIVISQKLQADVFKTCRSLIQECNDGKIVSFLTRSMRNFTAVRGFIREQAFSAGMLRIVSAALSKKPTSFYSEMIQLDCSNLLAALVYKEETCVVCTSKSAFCVFPCGHCCVCLSCASLLVKQECPMCRIPFDSWVELPAEEDVEAAVGESIDKLGEDSLER